MCNSRLRSPRSKVSRAIGSNARVLWGRTDGQHGFATGWTVAFAIQQVRAAFVNVERYHRPACLNVERYHRTAGLNVAVPLIRGQCPFVFQKHRSCGEHSTSSSRCSASVRGNLQGARPKFGQLPPSLPTLQIESGTYRTFDLFNSLFWPLLLLTSRVRFVGCRIEDKSSLVNAGVNAPYRGRLQWRPRRVTSGHPP